jgi:hypothetical protein
MKGVLEPSRFLEEGEKINPFILEGIGRGMEETLP